MERSDFSSLRVLVLGGKTHTIGILRSILSNAGVTKIIHVEQTARALDLLGMEHFSAVFCDQNAEGMDGMSFPVAATTAPRPFIVASEFFGPDRRARARAPWHGDDRRTRVAKKQKMDFTQV
jgi:CheY-like chemotaxis protein